MNLERHLVGPFPTTHWSVVLAAGKTDASGGSGAWEALARAYWRPIYAHARRRGRSHEDAQDLTQSFFATLIEKPALQRASPERGRFRSFLLAVFDHFLSDQQDRAAAQKRGGGWERIAWVASDADEFPDVEPAAPQVPLEHQFDRDWARSILGNAVRKLEQEFVEDGKQRSFSLLVPFLNRPPFPGEYAQVAAQLAVNPGLLPTVVARFRQRFRDLAVGEIAATVAGPVEVEGELTYLLELLTQ